MNVYVSGSTHLNGPLLVKPRACTDPDETITASTLGEEWPELQEVVLIPPGSAVIFDVRLAHGIRRPAGPCCRLLWGGHFQGRHNLAPHREDQDHSEIAELRRFAEFPTLFAPRDPPPPAPAEARL